MPVSVKDPRLLGQGIDVSFSSLDASANSGMIPLPVWHHQVYPADQLLVIPSEKMKAPQDMKDWMTRFARFIGLPDSGERHCSRHGLFNGSPALCPRR
jgi:hypothetical protein